MDSKDDRSHQLIAVAAAFIALVTISVALRTYTRLRMAKTLGADDWLIIAALVGSGALSGGTIIASQHGLGKHFGQEKLESYRIFIKADIAASTAHVISATLVKLSLLTFYLKLSPERPFRIATYTLIGISTAFGLASALGILLQCVPLSVLWGGSSTGHCVDVKNFYLAQAAIHMVTELMIYFLPVPTLWKLHLPVRQRVGLCVLMSIGAGLIAISCYRLLGLKHLFSSIDVTWNSATLNILYIVELDLAIFIACWPSFLAFYRHYLPAVFGGSSAKSREFHHSYQLGSTPRNIDSLGRRGRSHISGNKTTVTTMDQCFSSPNDSEELIITQPGGGIHKQVDVWVGNEDLEVGKEGARSTTSEHHV